MDALVISLTNNNKARREHIEMHFDKAGVAFDFFDAVTKDQIEKEQLLTGVDLSESKLNDSEKACFLSHAKIWKMMLDREIDYLAIFEDDIHLSESASMFLSDPNWIPVEMGLVKLEKSNKYYNITNKKIPAIGGRSLIKLKKTNWGSAGYIISLEYVRYLMKRLADKKTIMTVDDELFTPALNEGMELFMLEPAICIQDFTLNERKKSSFPSTIDPRKNKSEKNKLTPWTKMKRELSRISPFFLVERHLLSRRTKYL